MHRRSRPMRDKRRRSWRPRPQSNSNAFSLFSPIKLTLLSRSSAPAIAGQDRGKEGKRNSQMAPTQERDGRPQSQFMPFTYHSWYMYSWNRFQSLIENFLPFLSTLCPAHLQLERELYSYGERFIAAPTLPLLSLPFPSTYPHLSPEPSTSSKCHLTSEGQKTIRLGGLPPISSSLSLSLLPSPNVIARSSRCLLLSACQEKLHTTLHPYFTTGGRWRGIQPVTERRGWQVEY